jgi:hypothetical protein
LCRAGVVPVFGRIVTWPAESADAVSDPVPTRTPEMDLETTICAVAVAVPFSPAAAGLDSTAVEARVPGR